MAVISQCPSDADWKPERMFLRPRKTRDAANGSKDLLGLTRVGFSGLTR